MEEKKDKEPKEKKEEDKESEEELPFCTTAPSAEHTRASDEDEPCDDYREGE